MTRREAVKLMVKMHRHGARPLRWSIVNRELDTTQWDVVACYSPWLDVTPELLDDVETVTDDVVGYLENCFE